MPTQPWADLLAVALAGTRRVDLPVLPSLTPNLGAEADAAEKQLLLTAANLALLQRAGTRPASGPAEALPLAPPETRPALPRPAARRLEMLLAEDLAEPANGCISPMASVLLAALHELREWKHRLPPATAARLLHHPWARFITPATIRWVLGERAYWLYELTAAEPAPPPAGQAHRPDPMTAAQWQFDQLAHCMQFPMPADESYLDEFARQLPGRRTRLLWQAWQQHAGIALPGSLQADLDALLAATPAARRPWSTLAELPGLGGHPRLAGHPLLAQLAEWAAQLLVLEQPAAGSASVRITVPGTWPGAWQRAGLSQWSPRFKGRRDQWLQELLYHLGPQPWADAWQLPPADVVALVAAAPKGPLVLDAWAHSLAATGSTYWPQPAFARALLAAEAGLSMPTRLYLLPHLPLAEQLAWLAAALPTDLAAPAVPDWAQHLRQTVLLTEPAGLRLLLPPLAAALAAPRTPANARQCAELPNLLYYLAERAPASSYPKVQAALGAIRPLHPRTGPALELLLQSLVIRYDLLQACLLTPASPAIA